MVPGIRGRKAPAPALIWLVSDPIHSMSTQITDKKAVAFFKMSRSILQPLDVSSKPSQFLSLRRRQGTLRASALIRLSLSGPAAHRGFCKIHLPAHSAGSATVSANQIDNLCFEFETAISLPLRLRRNLKGQYRPISGVDQIRPGSIYPLASRRDRSVSSPSPSPCTPAWSRRMICGTSWSDCMPYQSACRIGKTSVAARIVRHAILRPKNAV